MTGEAEGKKLLGKANVYLHEKGKSNARITHIDIELDELNKIIEPGESSYVQGKEGGVFIGLKKDMISRSEKFLDDAQKSNKRKISDIKRAEKLLNLK